jgi:hypothetical protein
LGEIEEVLKQSNFKLVGPPNEIVLDASLVRKVQFLFLERYFGTNKFLVLKIADFLKVVLPAGIQDINITYSNSRDKELTGILL